MHTGMESTEIERKWYLHECEALTRGIEVNLARYSATLETLRSSDLPLNFVEARSESLRVKLATTRVELQKWNAVIPEIMKGGSDELIRHSTRR